MSNIVTGEVQANEGGYKPFTWGAGTTVTKKDGSAMSIAEAMKAGGLDFEVALHGGGAQVKVPGSPPRFVKDTQRFYTVRMDTLGILGNVGKSYRILQPVECFQFASDIVDSGEAVIEVVGSIKRGVKMFLSARLPQTEIKVKGIDEGLTPYLTLINGFNGGQSVTGFVSLRRPACQNELSYLLKEAPRVFRVRHTSTMQDKLAIQNGRQALGITVKYVAEFEDQIAKLLAQKVTEKQLDIFLNKLLPIPEVETTTMKLKDGRVVEAKNRGIKVATETQDKIREIYLTADNLNNIRGTAFGLLNACSEYSQHVVEGRATRKGEDAEKVKAENRFERVLNNQGIDAEAWALLTA